MGIDKVDDLIKQLRSEMEELTPCARLDVIGEITRGYCRRCGAETHGWDCCSPIVDLCKDVCDAPPPSS